MASRKGFVYDVESRANPGNTSPELSTYLNVLDVGLLENGPFNTLVEGLSANTTYYYRAFGYDDVEDLYVYGEEVSFTTDAYSEPTLTTPTLTDITFGSVNAASAVIDDGGQTVTEQGFVLSTTPDPTTEDTKHVVVGAFNKVIQQLLPATTYYIRAYTINSVGTGYSAGATFTTEDVALQTAAFNQGDVLQSKVVAKIRSAITRVLWSELNYTGTKPTLEVSNDNGVSWQEVQVGVRHNFASSSVDDALKYRIRAEEGPCVVQAPIKIQIN